MEINELKVELTKQILASNNLELLLNIRGILNAVSEQKQELDPSKLESLLNNLNSSQAGLDTQELQDSIDDIFKV